MPRSWQIQKKEDCETLTAFAHRRHMSHISSTHISLANIRQLVQAEDNVIRKYNVPAAMGLVGGWGGSSVETRLLFTTVP